MEIQSILSAQRTVAKVEGTSKKRLLEAVATLFADNIQSLDVNELYQSLINREKLGTTGIGSGIAIPHCRFSTGGATYCACMTLQSAIDFDSVDNAPVDIIFAMLVPENAESSHLEMLAALAEALQRDAFVEGLRSAKTNQELFQNALKI